MASLIHRWQLTENANDSVGTLNLTNNGGVTFGADGASFNGTNQWFSFTKTMPSVFSWAFWVKPNNHTGGKSFIDASQASGLYVPSDGTTLRPILGNAFSDYANQWNNTNYPTTAQTLLVMTRNGTAVNVYRGETALGEKTITAGTIDTSWTIGKGLYYYSGSMEDFRIYDYAISASEIAQLAAAGPNPLRFAQVF